MWSRTAQMWIGMTRLQVQVPPREPGWFAGRSGRGRAAASCWVACGAVAVGARGGHFGREIQRLTLQCNQPGLTARLVCVPSQPRGLPAPAWTEEAAEAPRAEAI